MWSALEGNLFSFGSPHVILLKKKKKVVVIKDETGLSVWNAIFDEPR